MKRFFSKIMRFWNEDRSLTAMLVLLLLFMFVLVPSMSLGKGGQFFVKIIYSIMLLTGVLSVAKNKKHLILIGIFAGIGLLLNWLSKVYPTTLVLIAHDLGGVFFNLFFAFVILIKTFKKGEITIQRIEGSIVVYLLIGLMFSYLFHAVYLFAGASSFNNIFGTDLKEFLYFSLTSLTTMGYGDITPVYPLARSLANFEALIGQLYPAILIARLVTMEFESSSKRKEKI